MNILFWFIEVIIYFFIVPLPICVGKCFVFYMCPLPPKCIKCKEISCIRDTTCETSGEYTVLQELTQVIFICCFSLKACWVSTDRTRSCFMRGKKLSQQIQTSASSLNPTLVPAVELLLRWEALLNVCVCVCVLEQRQTPSLVFGLFHFTFKELVKRCMHINVLLFGSVSTTASLLQSSQSLKRRRRRSTCPLRSLISHRGYQPHRLISYLAAFSASDIILTVCQNSESK